VSANESLGFPITDSEVGALMRGLDWSRSPLGKPDSWSRSLQTTIGLMLAARAEIVLFWGAEFAALYNDAYAPTIGDKHPRALGRPARENWTELWGDLEPLLRGVRETGKTFAAKERPFYIERHGYGETVYFDVSYSAVPEADGSVGGVLCIVSETTARVLSERRQAYLLRLANMVRPLADPVDIQAAAARVLGEYLGAVRVLYAEDSGDGSSVVVSRDYTDGIASAAGRYHYHDFDQAVLAAMRAGDTFARPDIAADRTLSGAEREVYTALGLGAALHVPLVKQGQLLAIFAVHYRGAHAFSPHEIAIVEETAEWTWAAVERARAEAQLRANSTHLSAIFDQAAAGIVECDTTGCLTRVNDRYCRIVGRQRHELIGLPMQDLMPPEDAVVRAALHQQAMKTNASCEATIRYLRPDGSVVWTQDNITPLLDLAGRPRSLLCVSVDITDRIRAEAKLRELNETLEERVAATVAQREAALAQLHEARKLEMIGQLTGGIAHDFNNLLTPIMGSLDLIRRRVTDERSQRIVFGGLQSAERAKILVNRLLTFARRQALEPRAVSPAALIAGMRDLIDRSLGPLIVVAIDMPIDLPAALVDPNQLELAILNLAVNARDAMPDGGRLTITGETEEITEEVVDGLAAGRYIRLSVSDTGTGMNAETLRRATEPFFSTKGLGKGTGLGLSAVQGLAMQSGGGFTLASDLGRGTTAILWLPLATEAVELAQTAETGIAAAPRQACVLLVDDEELVRETAALELRELGYEVIEANSAAAALAQINQGLRPDLLVTDHIMPGGTGAQLAHELRRIMQSLPVLMITGYAGSNPDLLKGFDVIAKPYRLNDLSTRVAELVARKRDSQADIVR